MQDGAYLMEKYNYEEAIINDLKDWLISETDILE